MDLKRLPIGIENFEEMINRGYYYADKTLFIKELHDKLCKVNLFTRPKRFGKSLALSMLQYFYDIALKDKANLFDGLNIMSAGEKYTSEMNKYPVIKLSLKSADGQSFKSAFFALKECITMEFNRHKYLLYSAKINGAEKNKIQDILNLYGKHADPDIFTNSLKFLSSCLEAHYGQKVIILIDEYDVPLEKSYFNKYYEDMVGFIRAFFDNGLKTNDSLHFAVLTGCLRVGRESIFTGFNNPKIVTILSSGYGEYFGLTEKEVGAAFKYYGKENKLKTAHDWYNGYIFGQTNLYNPWSIISYLSDLNENIDCYPRAYWANTGSNDIIHELIKSADKNTKDEIESLITGGCIEKKINEEVVYEEIGSNINNLWNFLFFTGYLKKISERQDNRDIYLKMDIPNQEVLSVYENKILEWFDEKTKVKDLKLLYEAIRSADYAAAENILCELLMETISFNDNYENFYHGFMTGVLSRMDGCLVKSNRESGNGRGDIFIMPIAYRNTTAIVMELKVADKIGDLEKKCGEALEQISKKGYVRELKDMGYGSIIKYGIAFFKKECMVFGCDSDK